MLLLLLFFKVLLIKKLHGPFLDEKESYLYLQNISSGNCRYTLTLAKNVKALHYD